MDSKLTKAAYCIEFFHAKSGYKEKLMRSLLSLVEPTRSESGCLQYDLLEDNTDHDLIILVVKFSDQESMKRHEQQAYIKAFSEKELKQYCEKFYWHDAREI